MMTRDPRIYELFRLLDGTESPDECYAILATAWSEGKQSADADLRQQLEEARAALLREGIRTGEIERELAATTKELGQRKGWQHCKTHENINADHAWGCPDCVHELRHQCADLQGKLELKEKIIAGCVADEGELETAMEALGMVCYDDYGALQHDTVLTAFVKDLQRQLVDAYQIIQQLQLRDGRGTIT